MDGTKKHDLTGRVFGRLTVLYRSENQVYRTKDGKKKEKSMWECQCECGNKKSIRQDHLLKGKTVSCGCLGIERRNMANTKHGEAHTRLYYVWIDMKNRCRNPNIACYKNYGGRGISVCSEWENSFSEFSKWATNNGYNENAAYGKCTLDRIDVNGPYNPSNCRFVDAKVQASNRRKK